MTNDNSKKDLFNQADLDFCHFYGNIFTEAVSCARLCEYKRMALAICVNRF